MSEKETATPRVDAAAFDLKREPGKPYTNLLIHSDGDYVHSSLARQLEREVAALTTQLAEKDKEMVRRLADLLCTVPTGAPFQSVLKRAEAAEAQRDELQKRIGYTAVPVAEGGANINPPKYEIVERLLDCAVTFDGEPATIMFQAANAIERLCLPPNETMSDHPGCVYCMEKGTPIRPGMVCPKCGDRLPTKREYEAQGLRAELDAPAKHWHDLYKKQCLLRQDDAARYGQQILDAEARIKDQVDAYVELEERTHKAESALALAAEDAAGLEELIRSTKAELDAAKRALAEKDARPIDGCSHRGKINRGYQGGYDLAWCDSCGVITWCSDGLISNEQARRSDRHEWCKRRVIAFGCSSEAKGEQLCEQWCGQKYCSVTIAALAQEASQGETDGR